MNRIIGTEWRALVNKSLVSKSKSQDVPMNHAWIEKIDFVYELSEGHKNSFSKDDYHKKNKIINVLKYMAKEAITLIGKYSHWGPWI